MQHNTIFSRLVVRIFAIVGLLLTLLPSILHFYGIIEPKEVNHWMAAGMILWFITGSFWLGRKKEG